MTRRGGGGLSRGRGGSLSGRSTPFSRGGIAHTVREATDTFYSALQAMFRGDSAPMKAAWWHDADTSYMGPGGDYVIGWDDISKEWDRQAALKLGGSVSPTRLHVVIGDDLAAINCIEVGSNEVDGKKTTVSIRSSTLFRRKGDVWKTIAHQTDMLGYVEPRQ